MAGRSAVVVEAGTATSTRLRTEPNAFNVLRIEPDEIDVEVQTWNGHAFSVESIQRFSRLEGTWGARAAETDTTLS